MQESYIYVSSLESDFWNVNVYFTDQNMIQREDPIEMNFEGLAMQK